MTFQVAFIGTDGLVLGSDRMFAYRGMQQALDGTIEASVQRLPGKKLLVSDSGLVICGHAGGPQSDTIARAIATSASPTNLSDLQWKNQIEGIVRKIRGSAPQITDEVVVVRTDNLGSALMVTRQGEYPPSFSPVTQQICTGDNSSARFLAKHLWHESMTVADLKTLALLTLTYAHRENPSGVGGGFDLIMLRAGNRRSQSSYTEAAGVSFCTSFHNHLTKVIRELAL